MKASLLVLLGIIVSASADAQTYTSSGALDDPIATHSTNNNYNDSTSTSTVRTDGSMSTTIKQPPPSAIAPQFSAGNNSDLCTIGVAGAVQTQILGISAGTTFTEENCIVEDCRITRSEQSNGSGVFPVSIICNEGIIRILKIYSIFFIMITRIINHLTFRAIP